MTLLIHLGGLKHDIRFQVSGIEGSFRNTCEITMSVLRDNKESLMAVLEAFVYDPLTTWRLMQTEVEIRRPEGWLSSQSYGSPRANDILVSETYTDRAAELAHVAAHPQAPMRKLKADENDIFNGNSRMSVYPGTVLNVENVEAQGQPGAQEVRNERALFVYNRVQHKLTGEEVCSVAAAT